MSETGKVNRRQYYISNYSVSKEGFAEKQIASDLFLLYDQELRIQEETDLDGRLWVLLGEAYSVDQVGKTPLDDIRNMRSEEVESRYFYWTGRWVLIGNNEIHMDAMGTMSLYYMNSEDGCWMATPSLNLMYTINKEKFLSFRQKMVSNSNLNWYPAPLCKLQDVYHLFPTQKLIILNNRLQAVYHDILSDAFKGMSRERQTNMLSLYLKNAIFNIESYSEREIYLPVTAGYDSRVMLALALSTNVKFTGYTFNYRNICGADKTIPSDMAEKYGFKYHLINMPHKRNEGLLREYDQHSFCTIDDADRGFYAQGAYEAIPPNAITVKCPFEVSSGFYHKRMSDTVDIRKKIEEQYPELVDNKEYQESISHWWKWVSTHPNCMDIRDRFYLEQRVGGWVSALQQSVDIIPSTQIQITNCAAILSVAYWYSDEEKQERQVCADQVKNLYPELLQIPINPSERLYNVWSYCKKGFRHPIISSKKVVYRIIRKIGRR